MVATDILKATIVAHSSGGPCRTHPHLRAATFSAPPLQLSQPLPCQRGQRQAIAGKETPPAIAALPDLSGQARPFTNAERQARIERARQLMTSAKIDAIVLANSTSSSVYFADLRLYGGERLWALVLPARGQAIPRLSRL